MLKSATSFDRFPFVPITRDSADCAVGWLEIAQKLSSSTLLSNECVIAVECYPGVDIEEIAAGMRSIFIGATVLHTKTAFLSAAELEKKFAASLGNDPVFGIMSHAVIQDFFDADKLVHLQDEIKQPGKTILVIGTGASVVAPDANTVIYADLARWEIQRRQRQHLIGNLGLDNAAATAAQLYKRAFFLDWRVADRLKCQLFERIDFLLDTNQAQQPKLITGELFRIGLKQTAASPFSVVPFFDPGPWGGHWMKEAFDLPENSSNYAWCFNCVPEENSLLLGFGEHRVEVPSLNVVLFQPQELLGPFVYSNFGAEFPIRFDYLDTMDGGNLSLQVHPLRQYIRETFGMDYTQDESYYMLQAANDGTVYLGLKDGVDRTAFERDLRNAQTDPSSPFPAEKYINIWPAQKHDHFLIPAGTVHCSGRNGVVLEISATPYIFTFKLWDWGRLGMDGKPRPIHLEHGLANIQWNRTTEWVRDHLINRVETLAHGDGWTEERTGLHELEFIETRRHWFTKLTPHHTGNTVNVLNLVEGTEAIVESPSAAFEPFVVHYGETFIVPAAVGAYTIRPSQQDGARHATLKAYVRENGNGF